MTEGLCVPHFFLPGFSGQVTWWQFPLWLQLCELPSSMASAVTCLSLCPFSNSFLIPCPSGLLFTPQHFIVCTTLSGKHPVCSGAVALLHITPGYRDANSSSIQPVSPHMWPGLRAPLPWAAGATWQYHHPWMNVGYPGPWTSGPSPDEETE